MKTKKQYHIMGVFRHKQIHKIEQAYSPKQAKLQAAFHFKLGGKDIREFIKDSNIKVGNSIIGGLLVAIGSAIASLS